MATITVPGAVSGGTLGISSKSTLSNGQQVVWQIPPRIGVCTIQVVPVGSATYAVQVTANPIEDVQADTASWFDVITGTAAQQQAIFASVTAVKVLQSAGAGTIVACIRGQ